MQRNQGLVLSVLLLVSCASTFASQKPAPKAACKISGAVNCVWNSPVVNTAAKIGSLYAAYTLGSRVYDCGKSYLTNRAEAAKAAAAAKGASSQPVPQQSANQE